jgi:hypothetical protein
MLEDAIHASEHDLISTMGRRTPRMQSSVTSTMEAEYITLSETMREILSNSWKVEETMYLCNQYQCQI